MGSGITEAGLQSGTPPTPDPKAVREREKYTGSSTPPVFQLSLTAIHLPEGKLLKLFRAQQRNGGSESESKQENSWYRAQRHLGYSQASLLKTDEGVFSL